MNGRCLGVAIFSTILLVGCFSSQPKPPSWYGNISKDDSLLVGFGSAKSLDSAKANALSDITNQINVEVSSSFTSSTKRDDDLITRKSSNDVLLDNAGIELNDVRYVKNEFDDGIFYIKAEIPKSTLVAQFKQSFDGEFNALNTRNFNQCQHISIKDYIALQKGIDSLQKWSLWISALGGASRSIAQLENILHNNAPLPTANLVISSNIPYNATEANELIENDLHKELGHFYTLDSNANNQLKAQVTAQGKPIRNGKNTYQFKIDILFDIVDCAGNKVFSTSVTSTNEATNYSEALRFASSRASVQLYKKIQEWIER